MLDFCLLNLLLNSLLKEILFLLKFKSREFEDSKIKF